MPISADSINIYAGYITGDERIRVEGRVNKRKNRRTKFSLEALSSFSTALVRVVESKEQKKEKKMSESDTDEDGGENGGSPDDKVFARSSVAFMTENNGEDGSREY